MKCRTIDVRRGGFGFLMERNSVNTQHLKFGSIKTGNEFKQIGTKAELSINRIYQTPLYFLFAGRYCYGGPRRY